MTPGPKAYEKQEDKPEDEGVGDGEEEEEEEESEISQTEGREEKMETAPES